MFEKSLIPALLAGVLAVGCSTAQAQEHGDDDPRRAEAAEQAEREIAEQQRHIAELRSELEAAERRFAEHQTELGDRRADLEKMRAGVEVRLVEIQRRSEQLADEARELENALGRHIDQGLGAQHAEVAELREKLTAVEEERRTLTDARDRTVAEMRRNYPDLRDSEMALHEAERRVDELRAQLASADGRAPLPPRGRPDRPFEAGEAGPRGPGRRRGRTDRPPTRADAGVADRVARLERTVDELRGMLERHGFPDARRQRAMAEMERREGGRRGTGERRGPRDGSRTGFGLTRDGEWPRGEARGPRERRRPPPDAGAVRGAADEARRELQRARAENEDLRTALAQMRAEMDRMRADFEAEMKRRQAESDGRDKRER